MSFVHPDDLRASHLRLFQKRRHRDTTSRLHAADPLQLANRDHLRIKVDVRDLRSCNFTSASSSVSGEGERRIDKSMARIQVHVFKEVRNFRGV